MRSHQEQYFWQILLPVLLSILIALCVGVGAIVASTSGTGLDDKWAQISLIFLILPFLLIGIVLILALIFAVRILAKFNRFLPPQLENISYIVQIIEIKVSNLAVNIAKPVIVIKSLRAGISRLLNRALHCSPRQWRKND